MFTDEEKRSLLSIARNSIARRLRLGTTATPSEVTPAMQEKSGVFVTLHKKGGLRGCIGNIEGRRPLSEAVADLALESAFGDPRFPALKPDEYPDIDVEISVLTKLTRVKSIDQIEVGKHGLYIKKGFHSGLLLPQVATEYGWDRETFLRQTCWKAGLPEDAWKEDAEIFVFGAEVFGEKEPPDNKAD